MIIIIISLTNILQMKQEQSPTIFYSISLCSLYRPPCWLSVKEPTCQFRKPRFDPWVGKIPWRRKWQPTPVSLPGKSHGQRNPAGCSPWGHRRVWHDLATKQHAHFTNEKHEIQQNQKVTNCLPPSEQQSLKSSSISILHSTVCLQCCIFNYLLQRCDRITLPVRDLLKFVKTMPLKCHVTFLYSVWYLYTSI